VQRPARILAGCLVKAEPHTASLAPIWSATANAAGRTKGAIAAWPPDDAGRPKLRQCLRKGYGGKGAERNWNSRTS